MFDCAGAAAAGAGADQPDDAPHPVEPIILVGGCCCCCCWAGAPHGSPDWKLPKVLLLWLVAAAGAAAGVEKSERMSCFTFFGGCWLGDADGAGALKSREKISLSGAAGAGAAGATGVEVPMGGVRAGT